VSVGQAQRVLIGMAVLHRPALLIADEPTSALDAGSQRDIVDLLRRLNRENGMALLYISHDLASVAELCTRVAVLRGGRIAETASIDARPRTAFDNLASAVCSLPDRSRTSVPQPASTCVPSDS